MSGGEYIAWALIIFLSDLTAVIVYEGWKKWRDRRLDINCDNCEEALPLNRTPDKAAYLCRKCMDAYFENHVGDFTDEQISKARKGYRRRKKK